MQRSEVAAAIFVYADQFDMLATQLRDLELHPETVIEVAMTSDGTLVARVDDLLDVTIPKDVTA